MGGDTLKTWLVCQIEPQQMQFSVTRIGSVTGPQMGGQIRRGRIWRFRGALHDFQSRGPQIPIFKEFWGPLDGKSGRPKNAKFNHDGSDPPFAAL